MNSEPTETQTMLYGSFLIVALGCGLIVARIASREQAERNYVCATKCYPHYGAMLGGRCSCDETKPAIEDVDSE